VCLAVAGTRDEMADLTTHLQYENSAMIAGACFFSWTEITGSCSGPWAEITDTSGVCSVVVDTRSCFGAWAVMTDTTGPCSDVVDTTRSCYGP